MFRAIASHSLLATLLFITTSTTNAEEHGVKLPPGFKISLYADHTLANDIYCMTLDHNGQLVVSSRGWVKRLKDTDGDGKADTAETLMKTATGGMGMCFGSFPGYLMFTGDGWMSEHLFPTIAVRMDTSPKRIVPLRFGEHGGHAMRKGPDGCWYVIGGNDAELAKVKLDPSSPIKNPEAGGILRFSKDMKKVECIAHGFRNPYDFDFTLLGDIITYDSDTERDFLLPWYSPTRIYHIAHGQHHGWRLPGHMQSLARRDYYPDTVDILAPIGRGSPTGVVCYRHYQFPNRYQGGVFALDWTFGKVWFLPLEADGSSYKTKPEVFLEPIGDNGFAPTDACVAPDGSLLVSIGGRGTRGAVYRIEYVGTKEVPARKWVEPKDEVQAILDAPQPLDAWSRSRWEHLARYYSSDAFLEVTAKEYETVRRRLRAIEVLTDVKNGMRGPHVEHIVKSPEWEVRARTAWSFGRQFPEGSEKMLFTLAHDKHPKVRVEALNTISDLASTLLLKREKADVRDAITENIAHPDKRVRLAVSRIISQLDGQEWSKISNAIEQDRQRAKLTYVLAEYHESPDVVGLLGEKFACARDGLLTAQPETCLAALRLLMLIDGDWCLQNAPQLVYSAYMLQKPRKEPREIEKEIRDHLRKIYPTGDKNVDHEAARYFAMIEDDDPATVAKILNRVTKDSSASDDVHHLIVLARLKGKREPTQTAAIADALFGLEKKWQGYQQKIKQNWAARLLEVVVDLVKKHPDLSEAMLKHPAFVHTSHVVFTSTFNAEQRQEAARLFLGAVRKEADVLWSPELVDLLATLPPDVHRPLFRRQWSDFSIRDAMLKHLVTESEVEDRSQLLDGLESSQRGTVVACLDALLKLPKGTAVDAVPILRRLRMEQREGKDKDLVQKLISLANRDLGSSFKSEDKIFESFEMKHPMEAKLLHADEENADHWKKQLAAAPWDKGDFARGAKLFQQRSCAACHTGSSRVGADLTGAAGRFSRDDLFTAILFPSRDVAPAFRVNDIETQDGKRFSGIVVFESADGVIVQLDAVNTVRIDSANIASRQPGKKSLMPSGLLKDLKPEDLADLYAYLKSLKP